MADDAETALLAMTTGIIANYVTNNRVTPEELPSLISATHAALAGASEPSVEESDPVEKPTASQIRKSVSDAGLVSFIDGKTYQSLKRHLNRHQITPADYRARYGLGPDYPMVAPAYAAKRSAIAKSLGLGQGGRKSKARPKATK